MNIKLLYNMNTFVKNTILPECLHNANTRYVFLVFGFLYTTLHSWTVRYSLKPIFSKYFLNVLHFAVNQVN